jgi:hypothetical protein
MVAKAISNTKHPQHIYSQESLNMTRLANKVSIITGAAQGIGLATALKFASRRCHRHRGVTMSNRRRSTPPWQQCQDHGGTSASVL